MPGSALAESYQRDAATGRWLPSQSGTKPCRLCRTMLPAAGVLLLSALGIRILEGHGPASGKGPKHSLLKAQALGILTRRELVYLVERGRADGDVDPDVEDELRREPSCFVWEKVASDGPKGFAIRPHRQPETNASKKVQVDLVIFGSELESLTTAIAAAKRGLSVAIVTDAPLGGLSSDSGGNLRYIDGLPHTPRTPSQLELYRALAVWGQVAIPSGVERRISRYLQNSYAGRITVIRAEDLGLTKVELSNGLRAVTTDSHVRVEAKRFLDTDAECRLGDLCGVEMSLQTPALAYGLVFDVTGLRRSDYGALRSSAKIDAFSLLKLAGATRAQVANVPGALESWHRLEASLRSDRTHVFDNCSYGYKALAQGFDFFMRCREARYPTADIRWLNSIRTMSGFNVSHLGAEANFNGVGYKLDEPILQNAHSIHQEARWQPIMRTEARGLTAYFRYVTGNDRLSIRIPDQFYVRRATAYFETLAPYAPDDFDSPITAKWWMTYPMDLRGLTPRPGFDDALISEIEDRPRRKLWRWNCRPSSCDTSIPNLYLLNKCSMSPKYFGGLRIIQNLINTGQAWVDGLPTDKGAGKSHRRPS